MYNVMMNKEIVLQKEKHGFKYTEQEKQEALKDHLSAPILGAENWIYTYAVKKRLTNTEYMRMLIDAHIQRGSRLDVVKEWEKDIKVKLGEWWDFCDKLSSEQK